MRHFANNPRKISQKELRQLRADLRELGDLGGFVHNLETDEIVGGNQRSEAIPGILSGKLTPVITQTYDPPNQQGTVSEGYFEWEGERFKYRAVRWDAATARRANIRANKAGGVWDFPVLEQWDFDELKGWGFDADFMQHMETGAAWLGEALQAPPEPEPSDAEPQVDRAAELQEVWQVQPGELFELGAHRLICGDCTDAATVARLMGEEKADMVFTDPPYNIDYGNIKHEKFKVRNIENDAMTDSEWLKFCEKIADCIESVTDGIVYLCHAPGRDGRVIASVMDRRFYCSTTIVWNKDTFTLGRGKYQNKYEPIWFGWVKTGVNFSDDRTLVNVWDIPRPKDSDEHPTMKPLELTSMAIRHASSKEHIVFDPFLGSGTTLLACENLSRRGRGIEISPAYCAVVLQRFQDAFGITGVRIE